MANYDGTGRSNYFKVKNVEAFKEDAIRAGFAIEESTAKPSYYSLFCDDESGCLPSTYTTEVADIDDEQEFDIVDFVQAHLNAECVFIWMHSGRESQKYISGSSMWVNHKGESGYIWLNDIYALATEANPEAEVTEATY